MAAKKKAGKATGPPKPAEKHVGTVEHYYPKVQAAAVKLDADLKVGDTIHIQGHSDDRTQKVTSMQLDHEPIAEAHRGESVGIQVPVKVHEHSEVTKVTGGAAPKKAAKAPRKAPKKAAKKSAKKAPRKAKKPAKKAKRPTKAKRAKKAVRKAPKRKSASSRRRAGKRPARRKR
ncbi:MAG: hypothetical protein LC620_01445 [Halobacteriales archaeon]|nr:hypothetical protein [Halobacteriales archaeon]